MKGFHCGKFLKSVSISQVLLADALISISVRISFNLHSSDKSSRLYFLDNIPVLVEISCSAQMSAHSNTDLRMNGWWYFLSYILQLIFQILLLTTKLDLSTQSTRNNQNKTYFSSEITAYSIFAHRQIMSLISRTFLKSPKISL
jgi:hypothetical protein